MTSKFREWCLQRSMCMQLQSSALYPFCMHIQCIVDPLLCGTQYLLVSEICDNISREARIQGTVRF